MNRKPPLALCVIALIWISCNKTSSSFESSLAIGSSPASTQASTDSQPEALSLSPAEYMAWVANQPKVLSNHVDLSGFTYRLQFTPKDLIVLQRLKDPDISLQLLKTEKDNLGPFQYYTFSICAPQGNDIIKYKAGSDNQKESRARYFSYEMQRDIKLVDGTDTLQCAMYQYENNYGVSPCTNFLLAFPTNGTDNAEGSLQDKTFILKDNIFGNGLITIVLQAKTLKRIPTLAIN